MNRFAFPVNNNNNNDSESAIRRKIARNQAKFEENEFNEIARGGGFQNYSPNDGDAFGDFRPRTTRQGVKRTISPGTARKTRWDRKVKGNKERKERNAVKRRGMNRFAFPVNNNNNNDSESAIRRKIARNQAKFEENEFNEIARGGGFQNYSPNDGDAFGDFRPRTTRQGVKRTISPGGARKTRWDRKVKVNKERKERNRMKRRE